MTGRNPAVDTNKNTFKFCFQGEGSVQGRSFFCFNSFAREELKKDE